MLDQMDRIILIIIYSLFFAIILTGILKRIKREEKISIISFFEIYYMLFYIFVPTIVLVFFESIELKIPFFSYSRKYFYCALIFSIIFYIAFSCSLKIKLKKRRCYEEKQLINTNSVNFLIANIIITFIGMISIYLWTKAYGKPWDIIKYASRIRSGHVVIYNKFTFLKPFCYFSIAGFYNNIIFKNKKYSIINKFLFTINILCSALFVLANDSRSFILSIVLCLIMYKLNKKLKINIKLVSKFILIFICLIFFFGKIDTFTYRIRNKEWKKNDNSKIINIITDNFAFTYTNVINIQYLIDIGEYNKSSEIDDIKMICMAWIPTRYKSENTSNLFEKNTSYYEAFSGTVPTDIITASIYKFNYFGLVFMPIFISLLLKKLEDSLSREKSDYSFMIYNIVASSVCQTLVDGYDLSFVLHAYFYLIVTYLIVYFICRRKEKNL